LRRQSRRSNLVTTFFSDRLPWYRNRLVAGAGSPLHRIPQATPAGA